MDVCRAAKEQAKQERMLERKEEKEKKRSSLGWEAADLFIHLFLSVCLSLSLSLLFPEKTINIGIQNTANEMTLVTQQWERGKNNLPYITCVMCLGNLYIHDNNKKRGKNLHYNQWGDVGHRREKKNNNRRPPK